MSMLIKYCTVYVLYSDPIEFVRDAAQLGGYPGFPRFFSDAYVCEGGRAGEWNVESVLLIVCLFYSVRGGVSIEGKGREQCDVWATLAKNVNDWSTWDIETTTVRGS
nr:unnamed protein product [Haemonchus contortus]